ncbi:secretion system protein E [bacterium]|nr:MAG: secretion system protein E [bacterium]
MPSIKDRIIQVLVEDKLISKEKLEDALLLQREKGGQLRDILVGAKLIDEDKLLAAMSRVFSKPSIDISRFKITPELLKLIPVNICRQYQIVPLALLADTITLAMADPLNILALDDVKALTGYKINPIIADSRRINQALEQWFDKGSSREMIEDLLEDIPDENIELIQERKEAELSLDDLGRLSRQAPVVSFVNSLLEHAVGLKVSDVLIEPQEESLRIRMRIDGMLKEQPGNPKAMCPLVVSRIKVMSGLDIAEHRLPQDGRFKLKLGEREVDFRVSVLPSSWGEKVVIRVLDKAQVKLDIDALGFQEGPLADLKKCAFRPYGMVLVTGPTGSGKTTTLYSLLKLVDRPKINIVTVEDPVEFQIPGINQVSIQPEAGLTFSSALRSILRQDPNVIMVGEIRDSETADIAIKSALTGHMVFSTLHTTTASGAVVRLVNMGIEPFLINSSVSCIVAQRLARVLCPNCKEKYELKEDVVARLKLSSVAGEPHIFFRPRGCRECFNTGYRLRVILAEILMVSPAIKELILHKAQEHKIKQCARDEGMLTLREDGLAKARAGITSLEEVIRVTAADE